MTGMDDEQLPGMPPPWPLRVTRTGEGRVVAVHVGPVLLSAFGAGDLEMRDLVICSLTEGSRFQGKTVAAAFGVQPSQVSRIRSRYREHGARGLAHQMGRPPILSAARLRQARQRAGQGLTHAEIGVRLGVSRSRISELLKKHGTLPAPDRLSGDTGGAGAAGGTGEPAQTARDGEGTAPGQHAGTAEGTTGGDGEQDTGGDGSGGEGATWQVARRIESGTVACRYAGAMLVHAFTDRIGARGLLAAGTGASAAGAGAPAAGLGVLVCTQMSFTLGALTLEQARHLAGADAGALAGLTSLPSLRAWRQRLGELADGCDPLALQRRLASQMLAIEPAESRVYLADDHLAEYTGHQAVALGRNPRRGKPAKGHDDTYICDLAGRAIAFTTGEPSALCTTLPPALPGLTDALPAGDKPGPGTRPLIVFDRGAAFPSTFTAVDAAGYDWLTWRRAPLQPTRLLPVLQAITLRGGRRRQVAWTDEQVTLKGYGKPVRQLSLFEHGKMAARAISGRPDACPAELAGWLRGRRAEENTLTYDMVNYGLDTLADYAADEVTSTKMKANPARTAARNAEAKAETALAGAEIALAKLLAGHAIPVKTRNDMLIPAARKKIAACQRKLEAAEAERKKHPAKLPASEIDPSATRAILHIRRRCLQLTLRLLAANAEHYLARHLNTYLQDDDEYRAITRETIIRGLAGTITYTPRNITVTLDQPGHGRVTRALKLLLAEINTRPPAIPGDGRPITYTLRQSQRLRCHDH
ncbi:MAG TPA: helix-turn-helix domain-containing protein [Streptosporangiaceae bacterium]|nr:helix-turn-helix domain-containing protein [Streptosporangiaceae bacterium]